MRDFNGSRNPSFSHGQATGLRSGGKIKTEYRIWLKIRERCYSKGCREYPLYGGRGIRMCDRWRGDGGFLNFLKDMGNRPSKDYSIDRIDNDGNYEPGNCRWATRLEQNRNSRHCVFVVYGGAKLCLNAWAEYFGVNKATIPRWIAKYGKEGAIQYGVERRMSCVKKICEGG